MSHHSQETSVRPRPAAPSARRWGALLTALALSLGVGLAGPSHGVAQASPAPASGAPAAPAAVVQSSVQAAAAARKLDAAVSGQGVAAIQLFEKRLNALRKSKGLKPLRFNLYATQDAYNWAKKMAATNTFRHTQSAAERPSMQRFTGSWQVWGENIAARSTVDVSGIFDQWVASPAHLANMLASDYDTYGVGFYTKRSGDKGTWAMYATTVFYKTKAGKSLVGSYSGVDAYVAAQPLVVSSSTMKSVAGGSVSIAGTAKVGATLKASVRAFSTPSVKLSYRWYRSGKAISGATRSSYKLTAADKGRAITVKVTGSRTGYAARTVTSKATAAVKAGTLGTKSVKVSGTAKVGKKLKASTSSWAPGGVKASYRWYRSGKSAAVGTGSTYKVKSADRGKTLRVKITGSKSGYTSKTVASRSTARVR
ncbi:CAP domain-containing protein [Galactobacter valiniphilus]|uniref:CAP domain-containing protein n=1 Tax=Galactobacter valiniphilus TaxID=2676122 RepID=UPI003734C6A5